MALLKGELDQKKTASLTKNRNSSRNRRDDQTTQSRNWFDVTKTQHKPEIGLTSQNSVLAAATQL